VEGIEFGCGRLLERGILGGFVAWIGLEGLYVDIVGNCPKGIWLWMAGLTWIFCMVF
jgi:hypothetical protein